MGSLVRKSPVQRRTRLPLLLTALAVALAVLLSSCEQGLTAEQKLEDFGYLFGILRDNHPYLDLKARVDGYNWLEHEKEFEEAVRASRDDKEYAQAIQRMLLMINNGHTTVLSPQVYAMISGWPQELGMKPWKDEAAKTDADTVQRWFTHAMSGFQVTAESLLPFRAWYCQGEYVVFWVSQDLGSSSGVSPGDTVVSIDGQPVHDFVKSMRGTTVIKYDPLGRRLFMRELFPPYTDKPYRVEFESPDGELVRAELRFGKQFTVGTPNLPTNLRSSTTNIYTCMLGDGKVAYLHIRQMTQYEQSKDEAAMLKEFFATLKDVTALIVDIRGNGGGDDRFWMLNIVRHLVNEPIVMRGGGAMRSGEFVLPFVIANSEIPVEGVSGRREILDKEELAFLLTPEELKNLPPEVLGPGFTAPTVWEATLEPTGEYPFRGKVFLLVDPSVFSSSESFAQFCKATGWATVVGEFTGGDGGGSSPAIVTLPNSKMVVFFPTAMGLNPDFTANEETHTIPDVIVERTRDDLVRLAEALRRGQIFSGPDPEYDTALRECLRMALEE